MLEEFDCLLVDSSPILSRAGSRIIATLADAVVLVNFLSFVTLFKLGCATKTHQRPGLL